jgi:hypothetical protein
MSFNCIYLFIFERKSQCTEKDALAFAQLPKLGERLSGELRDGSAKSCSVSRKVLNTLLSLFFPVVVYCMYTANE